MAGKRGDTSLRVFGNDDHERQQGVKRKNLGYKPVANRRYQVGCKITAWSSVWSVKPPPTVLPANGVKLTTMGSGAH